MWFVLLAFVIPSILCALLGLCLCIQHRNNSVDDPFAMDESILLLHQQKGMIHGYANSIESSPQMFIGIAQQHRERNNNFCRPSPPIPPSSSSIGNHRHQYYLPPCSSNWRMQSSHRMANANAELPSPLPPIIGQSRQFQFPSSIPIPPVLCPPPPAYSESINDGRWRERKWENPISSSISMSF